MNRGAASHLLGYLPYDGRVSSLGATVEMVLSLGMDERSDSKDGFRNRTTCGALFAMPHYGRRIHVLSLKISNRRSP